MTATIVHRPTPVARRARTGAVGGAMWALLPVAWGLVSLEDTEYGSPQFVAVAAAFWLFGVLPPVLLVAGHLALRDALDGDAGRVGRVGIVTAATGLAAMALGNGIEIASLSAGGDTVDWGHAIFLGGFLVSIAGALFVGITVIRRRRDGASRTAGWLLAFALPLGIAIGFVGSLVWPENDGAFFAAITVPTGVAWLLLGQSLTAERSPSATE
ncbi:MAG TPA: hypothetical protein VK402_04610 [Blastococcus sp.]|nr:hypothetical protein [Blastococcus sp.]